MGDPGVWADGSRYEDYIGRWSRTVAVEFLRRLGVPADSTWLDIGCGTGALTQTILQYARPSHVTGVEPSSGFVAYARATVTASPSQVRFLQGTATDLPFDDGRFDATVSGLMLNFVPEPARAVLEMARVTRPGGTIAAYVWDYAAGMQLMRHFWDAAASIDENGRELDEAHRFPICRPAALRALFETARLSDVECEAIDVPTVFADFDDYWKPFLGGTGPAPSYVASLSPSQREALRELIQARLPVGADGSISLTARAWAVHAVR